MSDIGRNEQKCAYRLNSVGDPVVVRRSKDAVRHFEHDILGPMPARLSAK